MSQVALIESMTSNVNIGINEVVSIFVAKHETELFRRKDKLADQIHKVKQALSDLTAKVVNGVDKSKYEADLPQLGLKVRVDHVHARWEGHYRCKAGNVEIEITASFVDGTEYRQTMSKSEIIPIHPVDLEERAALNERLSALNADLLDVMTQIKQISRKERQIRGRIAEMKLEQAGQSDLLNHPDLVKLIGA